jgi:hypothetical protein
MIFTVKQPFPVPLYSFPMALVPVREAIARCPLFFVFGSVGAPFTREEADFTSFILLGLPFSSYRLCQITTVDGMPDPR